MNDDDDDVDGGAAASAAVGGAHVCIYMSEWTRMFQICLFEVVGDCSKKPNAF